MFTLFASQISALFTNKERVVRYTLLHKLAQIFTGMKLYHGANHLETLPLIPRNYIHYKLALVMCGNMIDKFIRNRNLKWSSRIHLNELIISKIYSGTDGMFAITHPTNTVVNHSPPTLAAGKFIPFKRKRSSIGTNIQVTKTRKIETQPQVKDNPENKIDGSQRSGNSDGEIRKMSNIVLI
jgi:hypothetical protein